MFESIEWFTWEIFTSMETNAWWLMMCVFTFTCITFICTNVAIRTSLDRLERHLGITESSHSLLKRIRVWFYRVFFLRVYKK